MARLGARSWGLRSALVAATLAAVAGCLSGSPGRGPAAAPAAQPTELPPSAAATWYPAGQLPAANAAFSVAPYFVTIDSQRQGEPAIVTDAVTGKVLASVSPPTGSTGVIGVAAADDDHTFVLAAQSGASAVGFYELRLGPAGQPRPVVPLPVPTPAHRGGVAGAGRRQQARERDGDREERRDRGRLARVRRGASLGRAQRSRDRPVVVGQPVARLPVVGRIRLLPGDAATVGSSAAGHRG